MHAMGRLQWPNKRVTYNNNPRAAATRATTIKTTPNKSVNNRGNKSSSSRAAACLRMRPRWVPRKAYGACNALPCGVLLGVAQRLSMEYMQSLQLLKPGLLGQRPLVVITRDPEKVGACVAPPLLFSCVARLSSSLRRSIPVATTTQTTQLGPEQL